MTNEDKKIVADYMGWKYWPSGKGQCYRVSENGGDVIIHFDLNDAGLVVQEMQKRGDWKWFVYKAWRRGTMTTGIAGRIAWLFNADNFFSALAAWLKEGKK